MNAAADAPASIAPVAPIAIVLTGPAGVGKTTLGRAIAQRCNFRFIEGDEHHPPANITRMTRGRPLTDDDRLPWLASLAVILKQQLSLGQSLVMTCSALKQSYRQLLRDSHPNVKIISLEAPAAVLRDRLTHRRGHFFSPALLQSQLDDLQPAADADLRLDATRPMDELADAVARFTGCE